MKVLPYPHCLFANFLGHSCASDWASCIRASLWGGCICPCRRGGVVLLRLCGRLCSRRSRPPWSVHHLMCCTPSSAFHHAPCCIHVCVLGVPDMCCAVPVCWQAHCIGLAACRIGDHRSWHVEWQSTDRAESMYWVLCLCA